MSKGRFELKFSGYIDLDYENRWEETRFSQRLRKFYHTYIIKKEWELKHWDVLYYQMLSLETEIKKFLGMETGASAY